MAKKTVNVELVTAVVPIMAEVGDRLMIFNGVCVGVDTGKAAPVKTAKQPRKLPAKVVKTKKKIVRMSKVDAGDMREKVRQIIAKAAGKPVVNSDIVKQFGATYHKKPDVHAITRRLSELTRAGKIMADVGSGNKRLYSYTIAKGAEQVAA